MRKDNIEKILESEFYARKEWFGPSEVSSRCRLQKSASMDLCRKLVDAGKLEQRTRPDKHIEYRQPQRNINRMPLVATSEETDGRVYGQWSHCESHI